jgi:mono/diheme cytochrome c family protein
LQVTCNNWNLPSGWAFRLEPIFGLNDQSHQFLLRWGASYEIPGFVELASAPQKYRAKPNPLVRDPEAPTAGAVLFEEHCEECQGKEGLGGKKAPGLRAPEVQNAEPGSLFCILSNAVVRKGMPVWSKLPEPQRWQLVSYIKSLGATVTESAPEKKP